MARIRSIKPEFWSDATIASFDYFTRLFYIALWNFADDSGRGRALVKELAGFAFPLDDNLPNSEVERALQSLAAAGRVHLYESSGVRHFQIIKWDEHQKVDRPSKSRLPEPSENYRGNTRETIGEVSPQISHRSLESGIWNLESGSGSRECEDAPARPLKFEDIETDINPAGATQTPRGDPGELIRAASQLLGRGFNLNSVERKEWSGVAVMLLEQFSLEQILECLRVGILRSAELKRKYRFAYLAKDVPDHYASPDLRLVRQGVEARDADRAAQEAQERADAEEAERQAAEAERAERNAKLSTIKPPRMAESERLCQLQNRAPPP